MDSMELGAIGGFVSGVAVTAAQDLDAGERAMLDAQVAFFLRGPTNELFWREPAHRKMFNERCLAHADSLVGEYREA